MKIKGTTCREKRSRHQNGLRSITVSPCTRTVKLTSSNSRYINRQLIGTPACSGPKQLTSGFASGSETHPEAAIVGKLSITDSLKDPEISRVIINNPIVPPRDAASPAYAILNGAKIMFSIHNMHGVA